MTEMPTGGQASRAAPETSTLDLAAAAAAVADTAAKVGRSGPDTAAGSAGTMAGAGGSAGAMAGSGDAAGGSGDAAGGCGDAAGGCGDADGGSGDAAVSADELLDALVLLRRAQGELAGIEPILIAAARAAGVSWQALAPVLGVASRQAAERRYLRSVAAPTEQPDGSTRDTRDTRDARVQAERDRRAGRRAVTRWANDNTADLRRLAGQITALTDLDDAAGEALAQLHDALGDPDASALPGLLAAAQRHLRHHPGLTDQIDTVTAHTDQIRQHQPPRRGDTKRDRGGAGAS